jgi:hypothetical protein
MIIKIISGALLLFTVYMGIKHGWQLLNSKPSDIGPEMDLIRKLNLSQAVIKSFAVLTLLTTLLILFPQTFVPGNILNAIGILLIMSSLLNVREIKPALIEIPFMFIPLVLIYLKHPLADGN